MKKNIRRSIAEKTLIPIVIVFMIVISAFFVMSYRYILSFINRTESESLASIAESFHYRLQREIDADHIESEDEILDFVKMCGDDICDSFGLDYVSSLIPYFDTVEIEYLTISNAEYLNDEPSVVFVKNSDKPIVRQVISEEFRYVWKGEKETSIIEYDNEYGHELCYIISETLPGCRKFIVTFEESVGDLYRRTNRLFRILAGVTAAMFLLTLAAFYISLRKNVSIPAGKVSEAMNRFITDGSRTHIRLDENIDGEFGIISSAFNRMAGNIDRYIDDIRAFKSEEDRQKAEMDIAFKIQAGFLPEAEAYFSGCDIRAMLKPAREIGGDLYDYQQLDDDRMLILIADVSGKGISAALFMTAAIMLMHEFARMNLGPAEIFERTNRSLAERNPQLLFVTAFAGIYNNRTLEFTYTNAGHNLPYLVSGKAEALTGARSSVLGLFDDETYEQTTVTLSPGNILFLYTDGVNEATDISRKFFGTDRLEKLLSGYRPSKDRDIVSYVEKELSEFSRGAAQSDDITMLALKAKAKQSLMLRPSCDEFGNIRKMILESSIPAEHKLPLCLCAEEMFINICSYAFGEEAPEDERVYVSLSVSDHIELRFEDGGIPYDPRKDIADPDDYDIDTQIGGLGKIITVGIADDIRYEYRNKKNILTVIKYIAEE